MVLVRISPKLRPSFTNKPTGDLVTRNGRASSHAFDERIRAARRRLHPDGVDVDPLRERTPYFVDSERRELGFWGKANLGLIASVALPLPPDLLHPVEQSLVYVGS